MSATMEIKLDSKLKEALERKSRDLQQDPEATVIRLIRRFVEGHLLLPEQEFAEGLTVAEYLALSDDEEAALWDRWYIEADRQVESIVAEAGPDALPPE